ncbi:MAG: hypothetical protein JW709_10960 [Sedimentisphaerales bacterium]|nr:hypothetical protein [Sedimentisphaerales bacterium]
MTAAQAKDVGTKLIQLLTQQQLLYRQLQQLAHKQSELVDGQDPETLLRVLAGRQRLITRLAAVDRDLKPIREDWKNISNLLPTEQRQQAQELVENVQAILRDILARDESDSRKLNSQQQQVAGELRSTRQGKHVHNAYAAAAPVEPRYFDEKSS